MLRSTNMDVSDWVGRFLNPVVLPNAFCWRTPQAGLGNQMSLKSAVQGTSQDLCDSTEPNHQLVKPFVVTWIFRDSSRYDTEFYNIEKIVQLLICWHKHCITNHKENIYPCASRLVLETQRSSVHWAGWWHFYTITFAGIQWRLNNRLHLPLR